MNRMVLSFRFRSSGLTTVAAVNVPLPLRRSKVRRIDTASRPGDTAIRGVHALAMEGASAAMIIDVDAG